MSGEIIARRYSTALADVVLKGGDSDNVKAELENWSEMIDSNADLKGVFSNPSFNHISKEKVLEKLIDRTKPSKTTANFLRVLLRNSRLADLGAINDRFSAVLDERGGIVAAEITSARELPEAERAEFEKNLNKLTGKSVTVTYSVDKDIIGGVITRIGSTVFDGSVKTKLEHLKEQLIGRQFSS